AGHDAEHGAHRETALRGQEGRDLGDTQAWPGPVDGDWPDSAPYGRDPAHPVPVPDTDTTAPAPVIADMPGAGPAGSAAGPGQPPGAGKNSTDARRDTAGRDTP